MLKATEHTHSTSAVETVGPTKVCSLCLGRMTPEGLQGLSATCTVRAWLGVVKVPINHMFSLYTVL